MHHVLLLFLFSALVSSENITFSVRQEIGQPSENVTVQDVITINKDVFHLVVANQTMPVLNENQVYIQHDLSILQVINSSVENIEPGAFNITPYVSLIQISLNPLRTIKENVFNQVKVKELDLSQNQISSVAGAAFDNNTALQIVKLNNNQLKELDPDWFYGSSVYKISAVYNDITSVPSGAFKNLARNRPIKIRLSTNRIREIHEEAFDEDQTEIGLLRINGNKLTTLPAALFTNRTVKNIQINANRLRCFPEEVFGSGVEVLAFIDNFEFECDCLKKVRTWAEANEQVQVFYPSIICEDRVREVNIVFSYNKTYEIPLMPPAVEVDVYGNPIQVT